MGSNNTIWPSLGNADESATARNTSSTISDECTAYVRTPGKDPVACTTTSLGREASC